MREMKEEIKKGKKDVQEIKKGENDVQFYEISFPGKKIKLPIQKVEVAKLRLPKNNVRFRHLAKELPEEEMEKQIWSESETHDLYDNIEFSEGLKEPLFIDSKFTVVEGCRRLVCLKRLKSKYENTPKRKLFEEVTCAIFPPETTNEDIAIFQAGPHIKGRREWKRFNQAAHIYDLANDYNKSYDEISKAVSLSKTTIVRMIKTYKTVNRYHELYKEDKSWFHKYSYFEEWFRREDLKQWSSSNEYLEKVMRWIGTDKMTQGAQMRKLSFILSDPALVAFLDKSGVTFQDALERLALVKPATASPFYELIDKTQTALFRMPMEEMISAAENETKLIMLKRLQNNLRIMISEIEDIKSRGKKKRK